MVVGMTMGPARTLEHRRRTVGDHYTHDILVHITAAYSAPVYLNEDLVIFWLWLWYLFDSDIALAEESSSFHLGGTFSTLITGNAFGDNNYLLSCPPDPNATC